MKVLHIATMDHGGAGIATRRIHEALLQLGVESHILCRFKRSSATDITAAQPDMNLYRPPANPLLRKWKQVQRRRGKCLTEVERYERQMGVLDRQYGAAFTMPISNFDLARHPLVQEADILHLQWVENFVDYPTFFARVKKPIVWTFHDENIAFGGFHYSDEAARLAAPFAGIEGTFSSIKRNALASARNIHMVALSGMMERFYHNQALARQFPVEVIHNGIRPDDFSILDRRFCREVLGLPQDCKVIAFCASEINDPRKGLGILIQSLAGIVGNSHKIALLCVGSGALPEADFPIVGTGPIANSRLISMAYSAADLFALPSYQEAFAQTPVEAMACGCPVVAFPCSGTEELITDRNGVRCPDFSADALTAGIAAALGRQYDREAIRQDAIARFDIAHIAGQYLDLYQRCVS
ncbi:MAG: glycosyltransferase [Bacteroidales bacterium]|nr:glycosyltransferase [Bacteroidales bacterium]